MKKLLLAFSTVVLTQSMLLSQNDSITFFLYADVNNNASYEPNLGEHPLIGFCSSFEYLHNVNQTSQWSFKTDKNGKYTIHNLQNVVLPASNALHRSVGWPSDMQYNNQIWASGPGFQPENLSYNQVNEIPVYSLFGFKNTTFSSYLTVNNGAGNYSGAALFCIGTSSLLISTSPYCRNYKDTIVNENIPFMYTVTDGITTHTYTEMINIQWPYGNPFAGPCGSAGGAYYLNTPPELSSLGTYTLSFSGVTFSNWGYNDGLPGTYTMKIVVDSCSQVKGNVYTECGNDCYKGTGEYYSSDEVIYSTNGTYSTVAMPDYNGNYNILSPYSAQEYTLTAIPHTDFAFTCSTTATTTYYSNNFTNVMRNDKLSQVNTSNINCYSFVNSPGLTVPGGVFNLSPYYGISHPDYCSVLNHTGKFWVKLDPNTSLSALSANTPSYTNLYSLANGDSIVWDITDLRQYANNMTGSLFSLDLLMSTSAVIGNNFCVKSGVISQYPETSLLDNENNNCWEISGPYDPNDKHVTPKGLGTQGNIPLSTNELTYHINFQNVGNAPAVDVRVKDQLDNNIDWSTLEVIGSSHPVQTNISGTGFVTFLFDNIFLADSTHDEPKSHGFVTYKVKLKSSLSNGTQIKNFASIYFDYNSPVITNTVISTLSNITTGVNQKELNASVLISPSPTTGYLSIKTSTKISKIDILNSMGQVVLSKAFTYTQNTNLDLSNLSQGIYFVHINTESGSVTKKIIKE